MPCFRDKNPGSNSDDDIPPHDAFEIPDAAGREIAFIRFVIIRDSSDILILILISPDDRIRSLSLLFLSKFYNLKFL
jgi:hypothetical protein